MLQKIRSKSSSFGAKLLAGIICFVLAFFGFGAFNLFAVSEPAVASVNGEDITVSALSNAIEREKQRVEEMYGGEVSSVALDQFIDEDLLVNQLINRALLDQNATELDLVNSRREFLKQLENQPVFQEDGEFSAEKYQQVLASSGYSVQSYEQLAQIDSVLDQLIGANQNTVFMTPKEMHEEIAFKTQQRDIAFMMFQPSDFLDGITILDGEKEAFYDLHSTELRSEETFSFETVTLSIQPYIEAIDVSEEELQAFYETTVEAEISEAGRRGSHILLRTDDELSVEDAIVRLNEYKRNVLDDGASFEDLATEHSMDEGSAALGGDLGMTQRGVFVSEFESALWGLEVGEISDPVESAFGVHLIKLTEIEEIEIKSLEDRRDELILQLKTERAQEPFNDAMDELDRLSFEEPNSLDAVRDELGLEIVTHENVRASSTEGLFADATVKNGLLVDDVLVNRFNSVVINVDESTALVGRVQSSQPSRQLSYQEVVDEITQKLMDEQAETRKNDAIVEALARLDEDQDFGAIELLTNKTWEFKEGVKRDDFMLDPNIVERVFETPIPEDGRAYFRTPSYFDESMEFLVVISKFQLGDELLLSQEEKQSVSTQISDDSERNEILDYVQSLRSENSVEFLEYASSDES